VTTPALEIHDLDVSLRGTRVLEHVDLTLPPGEFLGLIGPNGGGKSVLLRTILGLQAADRGTILVHGRSPAAARGEVAYVAQYARFDADFPIRVLDVVLMGRLGPGLRSPRAPDDEDRAREALRRVGLETFGDRQIGRLSGGELQRVLIARALATDARLFLFDEPTASLDTRQVQSLHELLRELAGERTVVLVSHDIGVISHYVDSVACLNRSLVYHGGKEITREMIEETYGCEVDFVVHAHRHVVVPGHGHGEAGEQPP